MLVWAILYAAILSPIDAPSEESTILLDREPSINLIVDFKSCTYTKNQLLSENKVLESIHTDKIEKILLLEEHYKICDENHMIKKEEAKEWKASSIQLSKELEESNNGLPWYKIDFKSMSIGSILTLLAMLAI